MKFEVNQFGHPEIPSLQLSIANVPTTIAEYEPEIVEFALTFDGYSHFSDSLPEFANQTQQDFLASGRLPQSLDRLRGCLFYQQRQWRNEGTVPDAEAKQFIDALLCAIRAQVEMLCNKNSV